MKFTGFGTLSLLGFAVASPVKLAPRDLTVIQYNLQRVEYTVKQLDRALDARVGFDTAATRGYFNAILQSNQQLTQELTVGAMEIRKGPDVTAFDGLQLANLANPIAPIFEKISNTFIRQKRLAQTAGAQAAVLDGLIYMSMQAGAFVDSIISKQNFLGPGVGQPYKTRLLTAIDKAVTEYKKK